MNAETKTILVAKVVGPDGSDEALSHAAFSECIKKIDEAVTAQHGSLVGSVDDGVVAEFDQVDDALHAAFELNRLFPGEGGKGPTLRTGVTLAQPASTEIDPVKIAAVLANQAQSSAICVSADVLALIKDSDAYIVTELESTSSSSQGFSIEPAPNATGRAAPRSRQAFPWRSAAIAGVLAIVFAAIGIATWENQFSYDFEPADLTKYEFELPEKPSIAVLPFDNLSGDPENDYLGDGISENVISVLSVHPKLFVIARNSSFSFKGESIKVSQVAENLGVQYLLRGNIQVSNDQVRVTAQLVDALNGQFVWSNKFERSFDELFNLQDDIAGSIMTRLEVDLISGDTAEKALSDIANLEAFRLYQGALVNFQSFDRERLTLAEVNLRRALEINPKSASINGLLGWVYWYKEVLGIPSDDPGNLGIARNYAETAVELEPMWPTAYMVLGWIEIYLGNYVEARELVDKAIGLSPGGALHASLAGWAYSTLGDPKRGVDYLKLGMRTEPYFPLWVAHSLGFSLIMLEEYSEAAAVSNAIIASPSDDIWIKNGARYHLIVIAMARSEFQKARELVKESQEAIPDVNVTWFGYAFRYLQDKEFLQSYLDALRLAGLPENPPNSNGG